ncbi:MAG TPA: KUP/HAK/KT family potassium transporter, partial [Aestuariivirgaceae bacterium]|nr:KUP/HAK/KT family potassium transporter [Aestuariivirgaceae bacterium]
AAVMIPLIIVDGVFLLANLLKVASGGWVPLLIGAALVAAMMTWIRGAARLLAKTRRMDLPLPDLLRMLEANPPPRTPGTAVFLTADPQNAPTALLHSLKHYKVLHERNVIVNVRFVDSPHVAASERIEVTELAPFLSRANLTYGYMDTPNVPAAIGVGRKPGLDVMSTSFFLSRRSLRPSPHGGMPLWQDKLFIFLARNASDATQYFRIPTDRTVEIGTRIII